MRRTRLWHVTARALWDWWDDNCLRIAASLAFYTALSLAPLVLLIVGLAGLVLDQQQVASQLAAQFEGLMGPAGRELVTTILGATTPQGGTLSAALAAAAALFQGPERALLSRLLELAGSLLVLTGVFALLFRYVPDAEVRWRDVWLGGGITAVLFTLGKTAIGYYLRQAGVGSPYGAAGSPVVLLVWVYYSALIFFFGAEFTQAWATYHRAVTPKPNAVPGAAPQTKGTAAAERPPGA
jgi:uncharacterized BrkB/YihY/UPF0761 family membrane protein